ncbi:hypothetical protein AHiyo6_35800 [Arthrobacter sp. Hiyo6]|nr:hypothetical protein AHiyo6_35800 [Arthrobacter sp. Hiyo6]
MAGTLDDVVVGAGVEGGEHGRLFGPAGQHHHVGVAELPDAPKNLIAVNVRQPHIQSDDVGVLMSDHFNALTAPGGRVDFKPCLKENRLQQIAYIFVILDNHSYTQIAHGLTPMHP